MRKKLVGGALAFMAAVGGMAVAAPAADAATSCRTSSKNFDLPWQADEKVTIKLCITSYSNGNHKATATVTAYSWDDAQFEDLRFDGFELDLRVERYDRVMGRHKEDIAYWVSFPNDTRTYEAWAYTGAKGGWSADATVRADVNNDGKGYSTWDLYGSPLVG